MDGGRAHLSNGREGGWGGRQATLCGGSSLTARFQFQATDALILTALFVLKIFSGKFLLSTFAIVFLLRHDIVVG